MQEKRELITYLTGLLNDPKKLDAVVVDELIYIKDTYGDPRRTQLSNDSSVYELNQNFKALKKLDELIKEPVITRIGIDYKIKVLYQTRILHIPEDTRTLTNTHNQDHMVAISDKGELVVQRLKDLGKFTIKTPAMDVVKEFGLKSHLVFSETMGFDFDYLMIVTNKNNIKKVSKDLLTSLKKFPTIIMGLEKNEIILKVAPIKKDEKIGIVSENGKILIFKESQVRPMGKTAGGIKAIELTGTDKIADMFIYKNEPFIFIHDDQNGKLLSLEDLNEQKARGEMKRGQAGVICASVKKGQVIRGAIAIEEGAVRLAMENGRIDLFDSDKMDLKLPDDPLTKITNGKIIKMRKPRDEKEQGKGEFGMFGKEETPLEEAGV